MNLFRKSKINWFLKRKFRKFNSTSGTPSQYGQDKVVYDLLGKPKFGIFVDIGANDGVTYSNSLFFEQKNWTGVCIEPHPIMFKKLSNARNCDCVNACILNQDFQIDFLLVEGAGNMLSGISQFMDDRHLQRIDEEIYQHGGKKRIISVEAISPKTLLHRHSIQEIDYLSIDTEGCELMILKNFDFTEILVKVIGVENGSRSTELYNHLTSIGYCLHKCVGCDEIYIKESIIS